MVEFQAHRPAEQVPPAPPGFTVVTPLPATAPAQAIGAVGSATPAELVAFAHAALFSPTLRTLEQALQKRFLVNFPDLTSTKLRKYPPRSYATLKGHLDQTRQNQHSTKAVPGANVPTPIPDTLEMAQHQDRLDADAFTSTTDAVIFATLTALNQPERSLRIRP
jgi:hypothetical protein